MLASSNAKHCVFSRLKDAVWKHLDNHDGELPPLENILAVLNRTYPTIPAADDVMARQNALPDEGRLDNKVMDCVAVKTRDLCP